MNFKVSNRIGLCFKDTKSTTRPGSMRMSGKYTSGYAWVEFCMHDIWIFKWKVRWIENKYRSSSTRVLMPTSLTWQIIGNTSVDTYIVKRTNHRQHECWFLDHHHDKSSSTWVLIPISSIIQIIHNMSVDA